MKKISFILCIFVLTISCSSKRHSKIHIDSNTAAFEKIVNPPSSMSVFKYEFSMEGYSDDTILLNGSKSIGAIKVHSGLKEFYGIPPMKVVYDPLKAKNVNVHIEYHFY